MEVGPVFVPAQGVVTLEEVWAWYGNPAKEPDSLHLRERIFEGDRSRARKRQTEGLLLAGSRMRFRKRHYGQGFARAARYLLDRATCPTILDVGCGFGTQSIFLALKGAKVVAFDIDDGAVDVFRARIAYYEELAQRRLDVSAHCSGALEFDYAAFGPYDGVYSQFAFSCMQPSENVLAAMLPNLQHGARVAILDRNRLSWCKWRTEGSWRGVWSPPEVQQRLTDAGFRIAENRGGVVLPPFLWNLCEPTGRDILSRLDDVLCRLSWWLPVSHQILAERVVGCAEAYG